VIDGQGVGLLASCGMYTKSDGVSFYLGVLEVSIAVGEMSRLQAGGRIVQLVVSARSSIS